MKLKNPILVALLAAIAIVPLISNAQSDRPNSPAGPRKENGIKMEQYTPAAVDKAIKAKKPVAIFFTAEWCGYCQKLKAETFTDKKVQAKAKKMVFLLADMTDKNSTTPDESAAAEKYGIQGFPTTILISKSGKYLADASVVGYAPPATYGAALDKALKAK
ncbi:MAG: thioredoxin family protein [Armatimonadota bacterium]